MPDPALGFQIVPPSRRFRFGPFEADSRSGELRKHGIKVRLGQQTFQILLMLLEHPDEVVSREDLRMKLWPHDTVVEFDHSINAAIQKLRSALGETAEQSKYIETLPRRGYRFMGSVEVVQPTPVNLPAPMPVQEALETNPAPALEVPNTPHRLMWAAIAAAVLAAMALAGVRAWPSRVPRPSISFSMGEIGPMAAISPDGSAVVYTGPKGLSLRQMNLLEAIAIYRDSTLNGRPSWSPDGRNVVFGTLAGLVRLPMPNGPPTLLCPLPFATRGYAVAPDGSVLMAMHAGTPSAGRLYLVPAAGGDPVRLEVPGLPEDGMFYWPEFLPGGTSLLFAWAHAGAGDAGLYLATLERGKITRSPILLRRNMTAGHYSPLEGGRLLYLQNDRIYAQTLNVARGALEGTPQAVINDVLSDPAHHWASFSLSGNGVLAWQAGSDGLAQPTWFDRSGKVLGTTGPASLPDLVRLSPDEKRALLRTVAADAGYGVAESNRNRLIPIPGMIDNPLWMPRSSHIVYRRKDGDGYGVFERAAEGGVEKELRTCPGGGGLIDVSPDEKTLLYHAGPRLYSLRLDDPNAPPQLIAEAYQAKFSPDGHWIVYTHPTNDGREVYVQQFPSGGLPTQLTPNGGQDPVWRGDGQEIFYRKGPKIFAVKVHTKGTTFSAEEPEALFDVRVPSGMVGDAMPMDVSRDGSRILFTQAPEQRDSKTYVMTDWTAKLHQ